MNLIIDIGNTSVKAALVSKGVIISQERFESAVPELLGMFTGRRRIAGAIVSSVSSDPSGLLDWLRTRAGRVHHLTSQSK